MAKTFIRTEKGYICRIACKNCKQCKHGKCMLGLTMYEEDVVNRCGAFDLIDEMKQRCQTVGTTRRYSELLEGQEMQWRNAVEFLSGMLEQTDDQEKKKKILSSIEKAKANAAYFERKKIEEVEKESASIQVKKKFEYNDEFWKAVNRFIRSVSFARTPKDKRVTINKSAARPGRISCTKHIIITNIF